MNIQFDSISTNKFFEWMASKFLEVSMPSIQKSIETKFSDDELLTKKELCERILKCDVKTADDFFIYKKGFPYVDFGKNSRRYPKRQVEEWIRKSTKYN